MADKSIVELGIAQQMTDDALLPVYQGGETKSIEGALIKKYAKDSVRQYVDGAKQSADGAAVTPPQRTAREGVEAYADQAGQSATQSAGSAATAQGCGNCRRCVKDCRRRERNSGAEVGGRRPGQQDGGGKSRPMPPGPLRLRTSPKLTPRPRSLAAESAKTAAESSAIACRGKAAEAGQKQQKRAILRQRRQSLLLRRRSPKQTQRPRRQRRRLQRPKPRRQGQPVRRPRPPRRLHKGKAEAARDAAEVSAASAADSSTAAGASATAAAPALKPPLQRQGEASTSAGAAKTSETNAKKSETAAGLSADAAEQARQAIEALGVQGCNAGGRQSGGGGKVVASDGTVTLKFSIPRVRKGDKRLHGRPGVSISTIERTAGHWCGGDYGYHTITLSDGVRPPLRCTTAGTERAAATWQPACMTLPGNRLRWQLRRSWRPFPSNTWWVRMPPRSTWTTCWSRGSTTSQGTQTTTKDAWGLLDAPYLYAPLRVTVYENRTCVQLRLAPIGTSLRTRMIFPTGMVVKSPNTTML